MQSVVYGIHVVTFMTCVLMLYRRTSTCMSRRHNWFMLWITVTLFVIGTLDVAFDLYHNLVAFVFYKGPGGAEQDFTHISNWANVTRIEVSDNFQTVWLALEVCVSDAVLIYRCWITYSRRWSVIALSMLLWLAVVAAAVMVVYYMITAQEHMGLTTMLAVPKLQQWVTVFGALTITLNVCTTSLIVYRMWMVNRRMVLLLGKNNADGGRTSLSHVIRIIIESALLYTASCIATFVADLVGSTAIYSVAGVMVELAGISFNLIVIRVVQGTSIEHTTQNDIMRPPIALQVFQTVSVDRRVDRADPMLSSVEFKRKRVLSRMSGGPKYEAISALELTNVYYL
ncbi:hypothetical protein B0H21DRAFT_707667 [Amylocystis lapponica]|nr:hypothetical protein B0H21DRAFT_707667 [Amylocystis lapponica]